MSVPPTQTGKARPAGAGYGAVTDRAAGIITAALKLQVLREVGKTIDRIDDIDETATQDSVEFSL